jgi:hypothetical protein
MSAFPKLLPLLLLLVLPLLQLVPVLDLQLDVLLEKSVMTFLDQNVVLITKIVLKASTLESAVIPVNLVAVETMDLLLAVVYAETLLNSVVEISTMISVEQIKHVVEAPMYPTSVAILIKFALMELAYPQVLLLLLLLVLLLLEIITPSEKL